MYNIMLIDRARCVHKVRESKLYRLLGTPSIKRGIVVKGKRNIRNMMVTVTRRDLLEQVRSVFGTLPPIKRINRNKERERY